MILVHVMKILHLEEWSSSSLHVLLLPPSLSLSLSLSLAVHHPCPSRVCCWAGWWYPQLCLSRPSPVDCQGQHSCDLWTLQRHINCRSSRNYRMGHRARDGKGLKFIPLLSCDLIPIWLAGMYNSFLCCHVTPLEIQLESMYNYYNISRVGSL